MSDVSGVASLSRALRLYLDARNAAVTAARRALRISETDAKALLFIFANPGTRPTVLRDHLGITSAGVTTLIDRLVDRDVVRRDVDPDDRRVNRITSTIDIDAEPWSELGRFDADVEAAIGTRDPAVTEEFAALLEDILGAAASRR